MPQGMTRKIQTQTDDGQCRQQQTAKQGWWCNNLVDLCHHTYVAQVIMLNLYPYVVQCVTDDLSIYAQLVWCRQVTICSVQQSVELMQVQQYGNVPQSCCAHMTNLCVPLDCSATLGEWHQ